ncbi:Site-specific recombinase XerD [Paraburkholderia fungorum]|uniref:Site-specific recombinase XerD n=1 Tax=Paraburkholderia fungorum TaxID=134537 RepID=A0A1H1IGV7_9BURK|nr:site-specific integrase [Paraburkholderia fungorum]SDR36987.1 Site-specific recombinase XerD [Paraburkholderia fungorum]
MPRIFHALDDVQIRHWIAQKNPVAKADGDGLTFTLSANGTATWVLRYSRGERRRELTLGNYPDLTLAAARKQARMHRVAIDSGEDPAADKKTEKARTATAMTVSQLCDEFAQKVLTPPLAAGTIEEHTRNIDTFLRPKLGSLEVRRVRPSDIVFMLENADRSWQVTKKLLTTTKQLFSRGVGKRLIDVNPAYGIELEAILGKAPAVRKRIMLAKNELGTILPDIDSKIGRENGLMLRILLATCVRTSELVKAEKSLIDRDRGIWIVPDENTKTRMGFLVPLAPPVVAWINELWALSGDSDWLLPTRHAGRRAKHGDTHIGRKTLLDSLNNAFEAGRLKIRRFTPHDTRSTAKGHMRNMGVSREISELALSHKMRGMEGIYDVREDIPERREALNIWAQFVSECCEREPTPPTLAHV